MRFVVVKTVHLITTYLSMEYIKGSKSLSDKSLAVFIAMDLL